MPKGGVQVPKGDGSDLLVNVQSLVVSNSLQGTISFPDDTKNLSMAIDSTTSQMWLPRSICDKLENAFGLTYDGNTGLYLVNATTHSQLLDLNPEVTFTIAANASTSLTTNIVLPYAALDLIVGVPFYNSTSTIRYFPIRRATNTSQYTLGRVLLQEAYLIVDYDRGNFTIGQTNHITQRSVVHILSPVLKGKRGISSGVIIGLVVGLVAFVLILSIIVWLLRRRRSRKTRSQVHEMAVGGSVEKSDLVDGNTGGFWTSTVDLPNGHVVGAELMSDSVHELPEEQVKYQLMSNPVHELPGVEVQHELHAHTSDAREK